jgi:uncharacterized protein
MSLSFILPDGIVARDLTVSDAAELGPLNDAAAPAVPVTPVEDLARLIALCALPLGLQRDGRIVGFVLALTPGADYDSENYRYFERRASTSVYVDRIVIAEDERGNRLGKALYDAVFTEARSRGLAEVTCEVNIDPPNPGSMAFHRRLGFREVGRQATKGGAVTVALLAAPVEEEAA